MRSYPFQDFVNGAAKRALCRQQFIEHHTQAENIGAAIDEVPLAAGLFRAHVGGRAGPMSVFAELFVFQGQAEIGDVRSKLRIDEDIGRFDVAMHNAVDVRVVQGFGDGRHDFRSLAVHERGGLDPLAQVASFDKHGDDVAQPVSRLAVFVDANDGRVLQPSQDLRFGKIESRIVQQLAMGNFEGDRSLEHIVATAVNSAKSPFAQAGFDAIAAANAVGAPAQRVVSVGSDLDICFRLTRKRGPRPWPALGGKAVGRAGTRFIRSVERREAGPTPGQCGRGARPAGRRSCP